MLKLTILNAIPESYVLQNLSGPLAFFMFTFSINMERNVAKQKRGGEKNAQTVPVKKKKSSEETQLSNKNKDQTKGKSTQDKGI